MTAVPEIGETREQAGLRWYWLGKHWVPSVTTILKLGFPTSYGLTKWLKNQPDAETADRIRDEAAERGTKVHAACEVLMKESVWYPEPRLHGKDEIKMVEGFVGWYRETKPKIIAVEQFVSAQYAAGRADIICEIDGKVYVVDIKTSSGIYPSHKAQVAAYTKFFWDAKEEIDLVHGGILHLKSTTKKGYQWIPFSIEQTMEGIAAFKSAMELYQFVGGKPEPPMQEELPTKLTLEEETDNEPKPSRGKRSQSVPLELES